MGLNPFDIGSQTLLVWPSWVGGEGEDGEVYFEVEMRGTDSMEIIKLRAKLLKDILRAVQAAESKGVKDPVKKVLQAFKAKVNYENFKAKYKLI